MKLGFETLFVTALMAGAASLLAQTYTVTDLGAVSGQTQSIGYGLNDSGQAAGVSESPNGAIPTLFSGGEAINIGTLQGGDVSLATCINSSAEVAGYEPEASATNTFHAWVFSGGQLFDIHSPSLFPAGTKAAGINDAGIVVGEGDLTSANFHAFVYANGQMTDIGPPGAYQASAVAINNNGQILGNAYFTGGGGGVFIYANGKFTFLTAPKGASAAGAALNSLGEVAGTLYFNAGGTHVAVFSGGKWIDLGGLTNNVAVRGVGINTAGQVIATAFFPVQSYHPFRPGKHVAYITNGYGLVNLNALIPANSGYTLTDAIAINDAGQILCNASTPTSPKHALLLSPK